MGTQGSGDGQFEFPNGIAIDSADNVYVSDPNNQRVQKFSNTGAFITKWGSPGSGNGQFGGAQSIGLAIDSANNVYVSDSGNSRIQKFTSSGAFLAKWGTFGSADGADVPTKRA